MSKTVRQSGGDLFRLALQEYGDATQWWRIAQANGLKDPVITGLATLIIPTADTPDSGGLIDPRM